MRVRVSGCVGGLRRILKSMSPKSIPHPPLPGPPPREQTVGSVDGGGGGGEEESPWGGVWGVVVVARGTGGTGGLEDWRTGGLLRLVGGCCCEWSVAGGFFGWFLVGVAWKLHTD